MAGKANKIVEVEASVEALNRRTGETIGAALAQVAFIVSFRFNVCNASTLQRRKIQRFNSMIQPCVSIESRATCVGSS